jgi:hypothetical protein
VAVAWRARLQEGTHCIMKASIFLSTFVLLTPILGGAQSPSNGGKPNDLHHSRIVITGCLTKNSLKEFELVDQDGFENLPYSAVVHLDEYVGKTVTLYGRRAATPSHDAGIRGTHFQVSKVQSVSGQCKK